MKILCLHPWGASAEIFERQMSLICTLIGESHNYVFMDGPVPCGPAKELPASTKGPFYNWYDGLSSSNVKAAHDLVLEVIEDEGPFDGVIGFSQGASLALSILYHHEITRPHQPPLFRFGVFFCAVLSISPDVQFNTEVISRYTRYYKSVEEEEEKDDDSTMDDFKLLSPTPTHRATLLLPGQKRALVKDVIGLVRQLVKTGADHDDNASRKQWKTRGGEEGFPRVYHPLVNKARISIPTVHSIGRSDPLRRQSELQARLCNKGLTRVIEFQGAHKVPSNMNDLQAVVFAVEWAMRMAQMR
ncbi:serine hydrolase FSH [Aspergillus cavernicola]|uniref:Serine hydrolase FSH n=1 Tax=Aspergillus cavernicola TaxID=176166 RepID=A0ABR4HZL7_9EURO